MEGAKIYGYARVDEKAYVSKSAQVFGCATISDCSRVTNNAKVSGYVCTYDNSVIAGNAVVDGGTIVKNYAIISDDAEVHNNLDYFSFPLWFDGELSITWTRSNDKYIRDCGAEGRIFRRRFLCHCSASGIPDPAAPMRYAESRSGSP